MTASAMAVPGQRLHSLNGDLTPRVLALVVEWATLHRAELYENWRRLHSDEPPRRIAPLE